MYRYIPYPYLRRYYNINDYYKGYYNSYFNYIQNMVESQVATVDQNITNYGNMTDVSQNSIINQSLSTISDKSKEIII